MPQRMSDLLATQAHQAFVGRTAELDALNDALGRDGARVVHVHGIAGIGKTALLERFAKQARDAGVTVVRLDCRNVEPTEPGFLKALSHAIGGGDQDIGALTARLGDLGPATVLALDTYEVLRLLDTWLCRVFVPMLPENVRLFLFGRQRPLDTWADMPGWGRLLQSVAISPLSETEARDFLTSMGMNAEQVASIIPPTHGHPLALTLAAAAVREEPSGQWLREAPIQKALEELTQMFLADVGDVATRRVLEGAAVARRVTISLLRALFPEIAPQDAYERLRKLPFVEIASDGLVIHDAVRDAIAHSLHASDPSRHLAYRRAAWRQLITEAEAAAGVDLWRYTADMLYLIENPVVREAFFPSGTPSLMVEHAQPQDSEAIAAIVHAHESREAAEALMRWWRRQPQSFSVVRGRKGRVAGVCCKLRSDTAEPAWLLEDPITAQWFRHLEQWPMPRGAIALLCRRWLSVDEGDSPSDVQAAVWLDLKRIYMTLRPRLRRVYLTVCDLSAYASVAERLGFEVLSDREVDLNGVTYHSVVLDFGPASVDGWLSDIAAAELGIHHGQELLDVEARELVLEEDRVALTPLEFGVTRYLAARQGKAVSRSELLHNVWGTRYEGGSNVVDAVVHSLRGKLGSQASRIETVTGVGYRLRPR
ncbi:winged helix-turn-helix domain-containing protein [Halomonas sp. TRM85114]|uniref:winged helix-turn-helix domain-containing protein n=1 Tax=Halomonas jincaotanensis TaxID=2810616 RepID=UPI001BD5763A|nr:winged helix-turn-helix domain-containing protein [Halomonas jincaotanensis]MBS9402625.1 winged helix-turn-helix domain-containing protein [Halomonas jincaotanensis]